jgi:hypothetical protein
MLRSTFHSLLGGVLLAGALGGCLAPTLPLPPPEEPDTVEPLADGGWAIRGAATPGAIVIGLVERTGEGTVVEDRNADGRYRLVVDAERCDVVTLWQVDGDETSAKTRVVLQEVQGGRALDPDACVR